MKGPIGVKVKIEDGKECQKIIKIEVGPQRVKDTLDDIYKSITHDAQIPGFRKGKAPRDVIESRYNETANSEAIKQLAWEAYREAAKANGIKPISYPIIEDVNLSQTQILTFSAKVDVRPIIKLKSYIGIKIKKMSVEVTQDDMDKALEGLRESFSRREPDKEKVLPPLDDELAKRAGNFKDLAGLKEALKKQLESSKQQQQYSDTEKQLFDFLVKAHSFDVPQSMVDRQLEGMINDAKMRLAHQGHKKEEIESQEAKLKETQADNARIQVKIFFILEAIAEKENIHITDDELNKHIDKISSATGQDVAKFKQMMQERGLVEDLTQRLLHDKVTGFLMAKAKVK